MDPQTLRYARTHEWAHLEGNICTVGLTQYAVEQLQDIIFIDLPDVDDPVMAGDGFAEIESVKSVNDLYSPVNGDVVAVNEKLETDPSLISKDPYGAGWVVKIQVPKDTTLDHLLTLEQYQQQIASEEH
jgi:glycine cleavage system H protein